MKHSVKNNSNRRSAANRDSLGSGGDFSFSFASTSSFEINDNEDIGHIIDFIGKLQTEREHFVGECIDQTIRMDERIIQHKNEVREIKARAEQQVQELKKEIADAVKMIEQKQNELREKDKAIEQCTRLIQSLRARKFYFQIRLIHFKCFRYFRLFP